MDTQNLAVIHNAETNRFEVRVGKLVAVLEYRIAGNVMTIHHTGVPAELEGQGIGSRLARASLEFAREHSLKVVPLCWFVDGYIRRHSEYQSLL